MRDQKGSKMRRNIEQAVMRRRIMAKTRSPFVPSAAIPAQEQILAKVLMTTLIRRYRLFIDLQMICKNKSVRAYFGNKTDQKQRRQ